MQVIDGVEMMEVREAAAYAGRTPETVRRWVWAGRLPARRQGNRLLVRRADVARLRSGLAAGDDRTLSLEEWVTLVERTRRSGQQGVSARDLVLEERRGAGRGRS